MKKLKNKSSIITLTLMISMMVLVTGCSDSDPNEVKQPKTISHSAVESQGVIVKSNAKFAATIFRNDNPKYADHSIIPNGDTTLDITCPSGDGWTSITLYRESVTRKGEAIQVPREVGIKCSSYSLAKGCLSDKDFAKKKTFSAQNNSCDRSLPYPLPKMKS